LTLEDYMSAPILADPLCKFDYCVETDGATAFVVTSAERAKTLKSTPAYIHTAAQGMGFPVLYIANYYRESLTRAYEIEAVAKDLWKKSGLGPKNINVAQIYDHFTPWVLTTLEDMGFCKKGEAGAFYANGQAEIDGELPINTSGGMMSEAYMHGWSQLNEGVRQIRGTSTAQVKDCEFSLVASAAGCPTGAVILSR
jgi:acetyl-CoA acetyltransferase